MLSACKLFVPSRSKELPLNWPMQPISDVEFEDAKNCDIETLSSERYSASLEVDELSEGYELKSACDWAVFAYTCAERNKGDTLPATCTNAVSETVEKNPALLFRNQIFYYYFDEISLVKPPPLSEKSVIALNVDYHWSGLGVDDFISSDFTIDITQANSTPEVKVRPSKKYSATQEEIRDAIQALPKALADLLPIDSRMTLDVCTDNYPRWNVTLTFDDHSTLELSNHDSNFLVLGGPWQTVIDGKNYVQFSSNFLKALDKVVEKLGLAYGDPAAMYCYADQDVLDLAFPNHP